MKYVFGRYKCKILTVIVQVLTVCVSVQSVK